jgi:hypothetical protein
VIINRQHWAWAAFVILASVAASLLYVGEFHPGHVPGWIKLPASWHRDVHETGRSVAGTPLGLIYGSVAAAIFVFAALLGVRRKRPTLKVGRTQTWLKAHIWLTVLTIPLVLLHCDFRTGSPMTRWFLVIYAIVMASGFFGLALQHLLPRLMKEQVTGETIFEQIPHILDQLRESTSQLRKSLDPIATPAIENQRVASRGSPGGVAVAEPTSALMESAPDSSVQELKRFMDEKALPYLMARRGEKWLLGSQRVSDDEFRLLKMSVEVEWRERVEQLQSWCDERRQLDLQTRLQLWLHGWLLVHIPFSVLLLIFTAWHVVAALFYY